jgi:ectoine hydroxylase-related dioxygenase (phytanoyl-CoA dioxygenase family)
MPPDKLNFENETRTDFHQVFYEALRSDEGAPIKKVYSDFIKDIVAPIFDEDFVYQKFPSFRVHLPDDQAIHRWHYDSDDDHRHPDWEINFQIAITQMFGNNAMWLESVPGIKDYHPIEMVGGEFCIFNGNKCFHGNKPNDTGQTRVSFDFRVMAYSRYDESKNLESVTINRKFAIGDYYNLYKVNNV